MKTFNLTELININSLKKIAENIYAIAEINMAIVDVDGRIELIVGSRDICAKFHRVHPTTCNRCYISDKNINEQIKNGEYAIYKCLNNLWDVAIPIIISDMHIATIFFGQFFYEDEIIDIDFFREQAQKFGFDEKEYLEALSKIPILSKDKVMHIIEYYKGLVMTLAESGLRQLEYKNSKKELEKSQKYLNTIFNSVNDTIFIYNPCGDILDANETALSMFGYSRSELINMNITDITPEIILYFNYKCEGALHDIKKSNHIIFETIARKKDSNDEFWVELNIRDINIDGDERIIAVIRDITERKKAEIMSYNETIELEKLRMEFFANISHELKTPLNIILGVNKLISMNIQKKNIDREKIANNLNIERQNCLRLLRLINNLIDSTKLDAGYFELNMVNYNIVSIIEEITLSVAEYINSNNLNLIFDTEIEEKIIACDLDKIERIMLNLISNAVKFTSPGGDIFVNICHGEEFITVSVEDTGAGIPKEKLNVIFDRFRQVDKSFTRNHEGSGIGLSLVKSLVEMQGGKINVESKLGVGTRFCIKLPVRLVENSDSVKNIKLLDNTLSDCVERIRVEFSDIYMLCN